MEVAFELGMYDWIVVTAVLMGWIYSFHGAVESKNEIAEIEAHAQAIGHSNLAPKGVETELPAGLLLVVAQRPYITGIDESGSIKFPKQMRTPLCAEVELQVARLPDEINAPVGAGEAAGAKASHAPSAHTVGTT